MSDYRELGVIVLAAGKGTRMKSDLPKVLHRIHSKSMIMHVIDAITPLKGAQICVVVGHQAEAVRNEILSYLNVDFAFQKQLLGTGDAVKCAIPNLSATVKTVLVLCGDVPLIKTNTIRKLVDRHIRKGLSVSIVTVDMPDPSGYGRIIQDKNKNPLRIVEEKDAAGEEKTITTVNSGLYCFEKAALVRSLDRIKPNNIQQEYYLTDVIEIINRSGGKIGCFMAEDDRQVIGVNTIEELSKAESVLLSMTNELP